MKSKRFWPILAVILALLCLGLGGKKTTTGTLPPSTAATVSQTRPTTEPSRVTQAPTTKPAATQAPTTQPPTTQPEEDRNTGRDYVANRNSHKFHYPYCSSVDQMLDSNRWDYHGTREALIEKGYTPCKRCSP